MEYANYAKHHNEPVDGFILQAPVSDREALDDFFPTWRDSLADAEKLIAEGKKDHLMPVDKVPEVFSPITAYRFWSLVAPGYVFQLRFRVSWDYKADIVYRGDDDYFTSDLDDETVKRVWGRFEKPVLVLHSEKDEFVPSRVDSMALNKRYQEANPVVTKLSGLIPGASHAIHNEEGREWTATRVQDFLQDIVG